MSQFTEYRKICISIFLCIYKKENSWLKFLKSRYLIIEKSIVKMVKCLNLNYYDITTQQNRTELPYKCEFIA